MKKYLIILVLVVIAIAIGAYFFLFGKKDVCKNVIPEDAKAVLVIDAKQALKQMDFSISDIFKVLKHRQQKKEDDKSGWGIDMLAPMYGFVSTDNYVCGVFALSNAKDFEKRISEENISIESQRGFKWANKGEILLCFDDEKALAIGPVNMAESDRMRGKMVEWMKQGSHEVPVLSSLKKDDGVICLRSSLGVLPPAVSNQIAGNIQNVDMDNIFLNASLRVKEKSFLLSTELESEDENFTKYTSEFDNLFRPIDAQKLPACIEEPMLRVIANVKGEDVLPKLRENIVVRTMLVGINLCVDLDMMIKSIDGDVIIEYAGRSASSPTFVASAKIKNQDFLKNAKDWCTGSSTFGYSCQALDDKNFALQSGGNKYFFGVHDNFLYLSSDNGKTLHFSAPQLEKKNSLVWEQSQGKRLYASVDIGKMYNFYFLLSSAVSQDNNSVTGLDHINVSATDFKHVQYELTTREITTDFIKKLLK